jgi:hypothetical protein
MKKLASIAVASLCILSACHNKSENTESQVLTPTTADSLRVALADQDSLLSLMNEVADGMAQIKQMENILSSSNDLTAESSDRRQQIRNDMQVIQQTLQMRRDRLAELEKKIQNSSSNNATLQKSIATLKQQIADQESTIGQLRGELEKAHIHIEQLTANVDSLNTEVASVTAAKDQAEQTATTLTNELNTCYYAIGSKQELKDHKLIQTGFLRKTKIMPEDFEMNYFTTGDKRTLNSIDLHSRKAKVLTNQPADSYTITDAPNGNKVLKIQNPARFWSVSNYLVIQVD